ncbi:MAG: 23S rRNA (pseudouridine(1915)-N(3))-methyltransferase RlmH [Firmicutes bacterium]|nr:23S rRNA (pseudouridine(1915)-N(3))-methyltransferase RlmH [Bacillota bacterium]
MIKLISVGKIKENFYKEAIKEYEKRLSKYTKLNIIELEDEPNINGILKEGEKILKNINEKDYVITLEIEGNMLTSEELAKKIDETLQINSNITFVIGGSYGISNKVKERSNYKLSFSKQTFPHQLFRIMFLEQLYRTFKINNNETYHK